MNAERFKLVVRLFEHACSLEGAARSAFLVSECGNDAGLRRQVEAMLARDLDPIAPVGGPGGGVAMLAAGLARAERAPPDAPVGQLHDGDDRGFAADTLPVLSGQYRILRMIGEGGMGVVYEAEQVRPRRIVALKAIRPGMASQRMLQRFALEADILGRLHHPGIAQIYEAGAADEAQPDQAFFAMEYVGGTPLTDYAAERGLSIRQRLELLIKICDAVQHAHQRGVIHRDLKPGNILVQEADGGTPTPKILDFGVARLIGNDPQHPTMHTISGQLIGTLAYMSPEQVAGDPSEIDVRTDIYALGVIAYRLLSGQLPHDLSSHSLPEAARLIRDQVPPRLGLIDKALRGDIETIVAKAMEKDKARRYQSAAALGEDMQRFLDDRPIIARPPRALYQMSRFAKRHKPLAAALALVLLVVIAAVIFVAAYAIEADDARGKAVLAQKAEAGLRSVAETNATQARRQAYRANITATASALQVHDITLARQHLDAIDSVDRKNWEWRHFDSRLIDSVASMDIGNAALAAALLPDGQHLVTGTWNGELTLWDLQSQPATKKTLGRHKTTVYCVACSADGSLIASGSTDKTVRLWDGRNGAEIGVLNGHTDTISSIAFSPDGAQLASSSEDGTIRLWDARHGGAELRTLGGHSRSVTGVAFSPDGSRLASASHDGTVRFWSAATWEPLNVLNHPSELWALAFSPSGDLIATAAEDKVIRLWDATNGQMLTTMRGHTSRINALSFSPDGRMLASASLDRTIRLWNVELAMEVAVLHGHTQPVYSVMWTRDGAPGSAMLASASVDRTVRFWDPAIADGPDVIRAHQGAVSDVAFSPDGSMLATSSLDGTVRLWDAATALPIVSLHKNDEHVYSVAFSRDGRRLACASADKMVRIWNLANREIEAELAGHEDRVMAVAFSPDGHLVASCSHDHTARLWDVESHREIATLTGHTGRVHCVSFSDDDVGGRRVLTGSDDRTARLWDAQTGQTLAVLQGHTAPVYTAVFAPDGERIVTCSADETVRFWDSTTGAAVAAGVGGAQKLADHNGAGHLVFNHDGTRMATTTVDGAIRLWDTAANQEVALLRGHTYAVSTVAFSSDGNRLASGSIDRTIRLWETQPVSQRLEARRAAQESAGR